MTSRSRHVPKWIALACALTGSALSTEAQAHLVTTGLGPVYDGISHLFVSPDDLLPVIAMAFLAGLNGATAARRTLFVLTAAWLAGGVGGALSQHSILPGLATTISLLVLGALVALDRRLPSAVVTALATLLGLVHGWLNGAGLAAAGRDSLGLVGITAAIFVVVTLAAALVVRAGAGWKRIVVRVAGSWIAAIGLLMLGWQLRGRG